MSNEAKTPETWDVADWHYLWIPFAAATAWLVGARSVLSAGIVAAGFAFCWAAAFALLALTRPR